MVSLAVCVFGAAAHYLKWAWGNPWQLIGWLLSILFLLLAFLPQPRKLTTGLRLLIRLKTAFFLFWILVFVVSYLWNFSAVPWNGDSLFDESANDLGFLKSNIIGHPFQAAWFHGILYFAPVSCLGETWLGSIDSLTKYRGRPLTSS